ncbi:MAG: hypothetical protein AAF570_15740, partial [Bacteroidota bacterium]
MKPDEEAAFTIWTEKIDMVVTREGKRIDLKCLYVKRPKLEQTAHSRAHPHISGAILKQRNDVGIS